MVSRLVQKGKADGDICLFYLFICNRVNEVFPKIKIKTDLIKKITTVKRKLIYFR